MNPTDAAVEQGEVPSGQGGAIVVDEDALSPRFRAQLEATLAPLAVIIVVAVFVGRVRRLGTREVPRAA